MNGSDRGYGAAVLPSDAPICVFLLAFYAGGAFCTFPFNLWNYGVAEWNLSAATLRILGPDLGISMGLANFLEALRSGTIVTVGPYNKGMLNTTFRMTLTSRAPSP